MADKIFAKAPNSHPPPAEAPAGAPSGQSSGRRRWWIGPSLIVVIFLAGLLPMWVKAGRNASERDTVRREVRLVRLENLAAAAAIDARRGEYDSARQGASRFFTALRADLDLGPHSALGQTRAESSRTILARRDDLITLLARSDPACAEQLTEVYLTFRQSLHGSKSAGNSVPQPPRP